MPHQIIPPRGDEWNVPYLFRIPCTGIELPHIRVCSWKKIRKITPPGSEITKKTTWYFYKRRWSNWRPGGGGGFLKTVFHPRHYNAHVLLQAVRSGGCTCTCTCTPVSDSHNKRSIAVLLRALPMQAHVCTILVLPWSIVSAVGTPRIAVLSFVLLSALSAVHRPCTGA